MKNINYKTLVLGSLFILGGIASLAAQTVNYEADALPTAATPQWTRVFANASSTESGGVLNITSAQGQYEAFRMGSGGGGDNQAWNPLSFGSEVEFRLRVNSVDVSNGAAQAISVVDGVNIYAFSYGLNFIRDFYTPSNTSSVTSGVFNDYRISINGGTNVASLYVNGSLAFSTTGSAYAAKYLEIGNGFGALGGGAVDYDYVRWTNYTSAIPEASTFGMLLSVLGVVVFFGRKRELSRS